MGFFFPRIVTDLVRKQERLAICFRCPRLERGWGGETTARCTVCGCFVQPKALLASQKCPEGRW